MYGEDDESTEEQGSKKTERVPSKVGGGSYLDQEAVDENVKVYKKVVSFIILNINVQTQH